MSEGGHRRPVTVVVPVYGDLESLIDCIDSLLANVDTGIDSVLLVDDRGPRSDAIVTAVTARIAGVRGFRLERNPSNLGFVGTCNRAAFELDQTDNDLLFLNSDTVTTPGFLDELAAVLASSPRNGAVCPRSNNATIASLPYALRDPSVGRTDARTAQVFEAVSPLLPRQGVAPVAMGFCILVRRELVRRFGLFDEIYAPGYGEENDFCLRIGQAGFLSLIAHHALVFHAAGRSFTTTTKARLRSQHERILVKRFPDYPRVVRDYVYLQRDPVDVFADVIAPTTEPPRVLVHLDWASGGPDDAQAAVLAAVAALPESATRVTVALPPAFVARIRRQFPRLRVRSQTELDGIWDIAFASASGDRQLPLARLNRCSPRLVFPDDVPPTAREVANHLLTFSSETAVSVATQLLRDLASAPIDVAQLRRRWSTLTRQPDDSPGASFPTERQLVAVLRRIDRRLPAGLARARSAIAARLRGR